MKFIALFILFSFISLQAKESALHNKIKDLVVKYSLPSLSVMYLENDKKIEHEFFGARISGEDSKITADDSFHLGSCGKSFTAALILKLVDEGKITLEDLVTKYISQLDKKKFGDIKIKHLLTHSAGIDANVKGKLWSRMYSEAISPSEGRQLALDYLASSERTSKADKEFNYSNLGYMVLGQVVESIEKKTFEDVIKKKLLEPMKMYSCSFGPVGRGNNTKGPWGHEFSNEKMIPMNPKTIESDNPLAMAPAGGISCSQKDWAKFVFFAMNIGENQNYLSAKSRSFLFKENLDHYTYGGWSLKTEWTGNRIFWNAGSNTLNYSYVLGGLDKKFAFLINTNIYEPRVVDELIPFLQKFHLSRHQ